MPRVSVILPTYLRPLSLSRAVSSVLGQSYEDFELLIVDDAPSDETAAFATALEHPRVRYVPQTRNGGVARARNRGIAEAQGEFLAFLDDDDVWRPEKLQRQVDRFDQASGETGLVYTDFSAIGAGGVRRLGCLPAGRVQRQLLQGNFIGLSTAMIRREVPTRCGEFDPDLPAQEDWEYWLRVSRRWDVQPVAEDLVIYDDTEDCDPRGGLRRSRRVEANLAARAQIYSRFRDDLKAAGMAGGFCVETVRRAAAAGARGAACRAAVQGLLDQRFSPWVLQQCTLALLGRG